jgi:hypothetical protein
MSEDVWNSFSLKYGFPAGFLTLERILLTGFLLLLLMAISVGYGIWLGRSRAGVLKESDRNRPFK